MYSSINIVCKKYKIITSNILDGFQRQINQIDTRVG
jgi:hypothetical protein